MMHVKTASLIASVIAILASGEEPPVLEDEVVMLHAQMQVRSKSIQTTTTSIEDEDVADTYSLADQLKCSSGGGGGGVGVEPTVSIIAPMLPGEGVTTSQKQSDDPPGAGALRAALQFMSLLIVLDGVRRSLLLQREKPKHSGSSQAQQNKEDEKALETAWIDMVNAARSADEQSFNKILNNRILLKRVDVWGCTALHFAAMGGSIAIAAELLKRGAEVDAPDAGDETPLHIAAREGNASMCELLLGAGANMDAVTKDGLTPLAAAGFANQDRTCCVLTTCGAGVAGMADTELPPLIVAQMVQRVMAA